MSTARARSQDEQTLAIHDRATLALSLLDELPIPVIAGSGPSRADESDSLSRSLIELLDSDIGLNTQIRRFAKQFDPRVDELASADRLTAIVGPEALCDAVYSLRFLAAFERVDEDQRERSLRLKLWWHSVAVACAGRMLCEQVTRFGKPGTACDCGLMHDVGKLALAACYPKSYRRVMNRIRQERAGFCQFERDEFGIDHTVAGKHLALRWGLAPAVVEAIRYHHDACTGALGSSAARLPDLVHASDLLAHLATTDDNGHQPARDLDELAAALDVQPSVLLSVVDGLANRIEPFGAMVGIERITISTRGIGLEPLRRSTASTAAGFYHEPNSGIGAGRAQQRTGDAPEMLNMGGGWQGLAVSGHLERMESRSWRTSWLRRFLNILGTGTHPASVSDICQAAAQSVQSVLSVGPVVAFLGSSHSEVVFFGNAGLEDDARPRRSPGALHASNAGSAIGSAMANFAPSTHGVNGFVRAADGCELIWECCAGSVLRRPLWMLPIVTATELPGGKRSKLRGAVLVEAWEQEIRKLESDADGFDLLTGMMGLAASCAFTRTAFERDAERLTDRHRRSHDSQPGDVDQQLVSTIGAIAAGAAHEMNNPLSVISGRAQLLLADCDDDAIAKSLREITEQAHVASQIVADLMRYAKPETPKPQSVAVAEIVEPLLQHWHANLGLDAGRLAFSAVDRSMTVFADAGQVREILEAVVTNAVEATDPQTGVVNINSPCCASDEPVRIVVEDNGVGMSGDVLKHACDPFFSHRPAGRGRGLGLSLAYRLAKINHGNLRLESRVGSGTRVTIELPAGPADP